MSRLPARGRIDRSSPIGFTFDGKGMTGFSGDTLASALLANGIRITGRSFKYHRPRGILTDGGDEPNALVTLGSGSRVEPNCKAPMVELFDGLEARSQNCWPSPRFDVMAINSLFSPIFVAGFYYKTFMWPAAFWEQIYEPLIRRAAGLGKLSGAPDPDSYDRSHAFADVLVVGSGIAGLSAALGAARQGKRVLLIEADRDCGGRLLSENSAIDGVSCAKWASITVDKLSSLSNVTILNRTTLFGAFDGNSYGAVERITDHLTAPSSGQPRQRYWKIVAEKAVFATGATERPIVFGANDRPGIMMASAIQTYVNRYGVAPGRRAAIFTVCDSGYEVAADLLAAGIEVAAIIDARRDAVIPDISVRVIRGEIIAANGKCLKSVKVRPFDGKIESIACDLLGLAGGWNPNIGFASHLGARPDWCEKTQAFRQMNLPDSICFAGAADGALMRGAARLSGEQAGCHLPSKDPSLPLPVTAGSEPSSQNAAPPHVVQNCGGKSFVDFQHDVTVADVILAEQEGFRSIEHLKRYTTLGMATDQGKVGQVLGHAVLAQKRGAPIGAVGTIAARPPYTPVSLGALAGLHRGDHLKPVRHTPTHDWAKQNGASFVEAGLWKRAQWFSQPADKDWLASATREAKAVRASVGVCDVSTLGKIEITGPDAPLLLDRLYANLMSTLPVNKCRYGLMLREDGFVFDDGTVARIDHERFVVTTTTANAVTVMRHIDFATQVTWPELDVQACSITESWAQIAVAGPQSRALLQDLLPGHDLSNEAFPFMAATATTWAGLPLRIFRLSFSGELAYEIAVPTDFGDSLIRALSNTGHKYGCTPYGMEAMNILRIEKGHVTGSELNGQISAHDLSMGRMLSQKKDFIGRTLAERPALGEASRQALIGLKPVNPDEGFTAGSHLLPRGVPIAADRDQGHVTSVCLSAVYDHWIGLGMLAYGHERIGEIVRAVSPLRGTDVELEVCSPVFVDPKGERLRA